MPQGSGFKHRRCGEGRVSGVAMGAPQEHQGNSDGRHGARGGKANLAKQGLIAARWRGRLAPRLDTGKWWAGWISSQVGHGVLAGLGRWRAGGGVRVMAGHEAARWISSHRWDTG